MFLKFGKLGWIIIQFFRYLNRDEEREHTHVCMYMFRLLRAHKEIFLFGYIWKSYLVADDWSASCNDRESPDDSEQAPTGGEAAVQTPDETASEGVDSQEDDEEVAPRRPMRLASESEKQKEHLNIVFIGHVG